MLSRSFTLVLCALTGLLVTAPARSQSRPPMDWTTPSAGSSALTTSGVPGSSVPPQAVTTVPLRPASVAILLSDKRVITHVARLVNRYDATLVDIAEVLRSDGGSFYTFHFAVPGGGVPRRVTLRVAANREGAVEMVADPVGDY